RSTLLSHTTRRAPPRSSTLFPYTTLFRSGSAVRRLRERRRGGDRPVPHRGARQVGRDLAAHTAAAPRLRRPGAGALERPARALPDRKSTRLNSSHLGISYAVFCLKKKSDR